MNDALRAALDAGLFTLSDPGIGLFHACLKAGAPMTFTPGMRVLEAGCCEADWLHEAHRAWPDVHLVGVDWRAKDNVDGDGMVSRRNGNLLEPDLFHAESFDACVSLSAIEHMGLGHYSSDPLDPDGDSKVVANIWSWLKPGGWFYFDVPYNPEGYSVEGTACRIYDDDALDDRLYFCTGGADVACDPFKELFIAYCDSKTPRTLIEKPTKAAKRYYYVAMCWRKA